MGHGRTDSLSRSIGLGAGGSSVGESPLASPSAIQGMHGPSRRHSGWGEVEEEGDDGDKDGEGEGGKGEGEK